MKPLVNNNVRGVMTHVCRIKSILSLILFHSKMTHCWQSYSSLFVYDTQSYLNGNTVLSQGWHIHINRHTRTYISTLSHNTHVLRVYINQSGYNLFTSSSGLSGYGRGWSSVIKLLLVVPVLYDRVGEYAWDRFTHSTLFFFRVSLVKVARRLSAMSHALGGITCYEWRFRHDHMRRLRERLQGTDGHLFYLDVRAVEWVIYLLYLSFNNNIR